MFASGNISFTANNSVVVAAGYAVGQVLVNANNNVLKGSYVAEQGLGPMANGTMISAFPAIGTFVSPGLPSWGGSGSGTTGLSMSGWRRL
jgi:hypothetical protein